VILDEMVKESFTEVSLLEWWIFWIIIDSSYSGNLLSSGMILKLILVSVWFIEEIRNRLQGEYAKMNIMKNIHSSLDNWCISHDCEDGDSKNVYNIITIEYQFHHSYFFMYILEIQSHYEIIIFSKYICLLESIEYSDNYLKFAVIFNFLY